LLITTSYAEGISKKVSDLISEIVPGEGYTETSIDLRENNSPDFSILAVRELAETDDGNFFTQFSLFNTEKNGSERWVGNLGFGKRMLSDDKFSMTGINAFIDYDSKQNARGSIGIEAKNAVLEFNSNYYQELPNSFGNEVGEKVLDGYDFRLASQIPYLHWANAFVNSYHWKGADRDDVDGIMLGTDMLLSSTMNLELAFDDKDKAGVEDEWYAKLQFFYPPREGATAQDGISDTMWREEKDMTDQLLTKVKRQNKIMIEFKGNSKITRTD
tara:strand:- start:6 stop:821 length:816 start_codon:yes stop_codon:yes gene_type:complete